MRKDALEEWLKIFLYQNQDHRKYLTQTDEGDMLNWKLLERDRIVLKVKTTKNGKTVNEQYC
ncbi:MAG: hypothetical protein FGF48_09005 [Candidatus Brockarchaeota archaeon]|nr:hypothetical protein [Candidatus Brockarchaeota archaeon]